MTDQKPDAKKPTNDNVAPDGEELREEIREIREKNKDAPTGTGHPGDPQVGGSGPGATGHQS